MNHDPFGFDQFAPSYAQTQMPPAAFPAPASGVQQSQIDDLRTGGLWLIAGLGISTLIIGAYFFHKNSDEHNQIKGYVNDYIMEHSLTHRAVNARVAALENRLGLPSPSMAVWDQQPVTVPMMPFLEAEPTTRRMADFSKQPTLFLERPTVVMSGAPTRVMSRAGTRAMASGRRGR